MLSDLSRCAYRLGLDFGARAEGEADWARKLDYFQLFDRCFFAVRVATALELRLGRTPGTAPAWAPAGAEDLRDRADPPEDERLERDADAHSDADRDRDRETERASLPVLLRTLDAVAAEAAALPGPEPSDLPTLRELLAHVAAAPSSPPAPPPKAALRARLAGSGATLQLAVRPPSPSLRPDPRRATGPPRP